MTDLQMELVLGTYLAITIYGLLHYLDARKKFFDECDKYKRLTGQRHPKDFRKDSSDHH